MKRKTDPRSIALFRQIERNHNSRLTGALPGARLPPSAAKLKEDSTVQAPEAHSEFRHSFVEVTPELAEEWLENPFERQRALRDHHVILLAEEMEAGTFIPHSAVVFAELDGKSYLIDGQHRLKAISLYGQPVKMPVIRRGAISMKQIEEWYSSIDQGLRRTAHDAIRAQGLSGELGISETHAGRLSGAVRLIASEFIDMTAGVGKDKHIRMRGARSNALVSELLRAWAPEAKTYFELVHGGEAANMYLFLRASVIACGLLTIRHSPEKAREFWLGVARDDGLRAHDPRKRLLNWLRNGKRIRPGNAARGFAVAWRAFLEGKELQLIRFDQSKPIEIAMVPLGQEVEAAAALRALPTEGTPSEYAQPRGGHARSHRLAEDVQSLPL
jgi:hypothetical protein